MKKYVTKVIKTILFSCLLWNIGLYDALLVSQKDTAKPVIRPTKSEQKLLFVHATELQRQTDFGEVGDSFCNVYYTNIPLALFYLLILFLQDKRKIRNPIGVFISSILYPIVLGKLFYDWMKMMDSTMCRTDAENIIREKLQQTRRRFLTVIAEDEIEFLRNALERIIQEVKLIFLNAIILLEFISYPELKGHLQNIDHIPRRLNLANA